MVRLKVVSKDEVRLNQDLLDQLGAEPGDELDIQLVSRSNFANQTIGRGKIEDLFGILSNRAGHTFSIEEMNEAIGAGWAGEPEE